MEHPYPTERWPAGHRAALVVVVRMAVADEAGSPASGEGLDYAATGLQRLLRTLADLGIGGTTVWSGEALTGSPQLARIALEEGHDVVPSAAPDARELVARLTGTPANGAMSDNADDDPFAWVVSRRGGDLPAIVQGGTVSIPTSPFWDDAAWFNPLHPSPPSALLETWSQGLQAVRADGHLMTVILHPHLSGRPGFMETIARFLDEAIGAGDVWIPRGSELAAWWTSRFPRTEER